MCTTTRDARKALEVEYDWLVHQLDALALGPALERLVVRLEALLALVRQEDPPDAQR